LKSFANVGWEQASAINGVTSQLVQNLWSGLGNITEVTISTVAGKHAMIVKNIGLPSDPDDFEQQRDHSSYGVEARFYDQGHAHRLCNAGAQCPLPLCIESAKDGSLSICMTRLPGLSCAGGAGKAEVQAALSWLARLHSMYWGNERADDAVRTGLHAQGCYWNLDARRLELARTPTEGLEGRLRLAASAVHTRLKADSLQTICHGDPKDANIIGVGDGSVGFCDFQWTGKAPPTKDLAYCLACGADSLTFEEESCYLEHYHRELTICLNAQGDRVPNFDH